MWSALEVVLTQYLECYISAIIIIIMLGEEGEKTMKCFINNWH